MRDLPFHFSAMAATAARIGLLLGALAAPVLAMPLADAGEGILVGGKVERTSGAGLVIVVGLQRAR
ncbi:hypothetical protein ABGN05_21280 [Aquibium sp. LZ166]|uniref:Uncharacterized protein n=1 Tax=Aquibium pacificus TaxID=3153579 RepID=A0ABV3SN44_9HYPH